MVQERRRIPGSFIHYVPKEPSSSGSIAPPVPPYAPPPTSSGSAQTKQQRSEAHTSHLNREQSGKPSYVSHDHRGGGTLQVPATEQKHKRTQCSDDWEASPRPKKQVKRDITVTDTLNSHTEHREQRFLQDASLVGSNTWEDRQNVSMGEDAGVQPSNFLTSVDPGFSAPGHEVGLSREGPPRLPENNTKAFVLPTYQHNGHGQNDMSERALPSFSTTSFNESTETTYHSPFKGELYTQMSHPNLDAPSLSSSSETSRNFVSDHYEQALVSVTGLPSEPTTQAVTLFEPERRNDSHLSHSQETHSPSPFVTTTSPSPAATITSPSTLLTIFLPSSSATDALEPIQMQYSDVPISPAEQTHTTSSDHKFDSQEAHTPSPLVTATSPSPAAPIVSPSLSLAIVLPSLFATDVSPPSKTTAAYVLASTTEQDPTISSPHGPDASSELTESIPPSPGHLARHAISAQQPLETARPSLNPRLSSSSIPEPGTQCPSVGIKEPVLDESNSTTDVALAADVHDYMTIQHMSSSPVEHPDAADTVTSEIVRLTEIDGPSTAHSPASESPPLSPLTPLASPSLSPPPLHLPKAVSAPPREYPKAAVVYGSQAKNMTEFTHILLCNMRHLMPRK